MIQLSEKLLADAGGWQAMKEARGILAAGRVLEAKYEPPQLVGRVKGGDVEYRSGLKIESKTEIENTCTCIDSRKRGLVCAHSLAVGLAVIKGLPAAAAPATAAPVPKPDPVSGPFSTDEGDPITLHVILPPNFMPAWDRGSVMVVVEAESGGKRKPLSLPPVGRKYRVSDADLKLGQKLFALSAGKLSGMVTCKREEVLALLAESAGHPRMTFGKGRRRSFPRIRLLLC